jgi:deoxycytidine triphosphate deaminase
MAVQQIRGRTTNSQDKFESCSFSSNSFIYTNASDENIEPFSLELTLGNGWNDSYSPSDKSMIMIKDEIQIQKFGSIVVEVAEEIRVPHNRYGIVMPTGSLFLTKGVVFAPAKVEPAFADKLKIRLFNTTQKSVSIKKGDKLASVIFLPTETTERQIRAIRGSDISRKPPSQLDDLKRWLSQHKAIWVGWIFSFISSSLMAVLITYFAYYKPMLEVSKQRSETNPEASSESKKMQSGVNTEDKKSN